MPLQFNGQRIDDPEGREARDMEALGGIDRTVFLDLLDDAINHASVPGRQDPAAQPWVPMGPRNIGGRIRTLAQDPANANTIFAGSGFGGMWKTEDAGDTWRPLDDLRPPNPPNTARQAVPIGAIAIAPGNRRIVYAGTGEPPLSTTGAEYHYPGMGLYRSIDGGDTFNLIDPSDPPPGPPPANPQINARRYERIIVDPSNADRCWIACHKGLWRREAGAQEFRQDVIDAAGAPAAAAQNASDVVIDFGDPAITTRYTIYVALNGDAIYRATFDRVTTSYVGPPANPAWTRVMTGITVAPFNRVKIAMCRSAPNHLYAVFGNPDRTASEVFRTSNRGDRWEQTTARTDPDNNQANYDLVLEVHPENADIVFMGTVNLFRSVDGGNSWVQVIDWRKHDRGEHGQHGDQHALLFDGLDPRKIWVGNDGGISMSRDLGATWRERSHGILACQFYDLAVHPSFAFITGGGLHDNGSWVGFGGTTWYQVLGGDGGMMAFTPGNAQQVYATHQGQPAPDQSSINQCNLQFQVPVPPPPANTLYLTPLPDLAAAPDAIPFLWANPTSLTANFTHVGSFVAIIEHHPTIANHLLAGRVGGIYVSTDGVTFNQTAGAPALSSPADEISCIAYAVADATNNTWWIGTDQGQVFRTTNGGGAWNPIALPGIGTRWIAKIAVHPLNVNIAAIAVARNPGRVYLTGDGGTTWEEISGRSLPAGVPNGPTSAANEELNPSPITSLVFDPRGAAPAAGAPVTIYVGTLAGVYVIRNAIPPVAPPPPPPLPTPPVWRTFNRSLPLTLVYDLATVSEALAGPPAAQRSALRCATHGRGIWECDLDGTPDVRLLIRDTPIDDGRTRPAPFNQDPRRTPMTALRFDQAYDIRVDAPPFLFFDEVMDGVEFDEELVNDTAIAGERNLVYVQVHQTGARAVVENAMVHLYFANTQPGPLTVPALHPTFWNAFPGDPPAAGLWRRVALPLPARGLGAAQPSVVRFDWTPPADSAAQVALLAFVTHADDNILGPPAPELVVNPLASPNLIVTERRAALRIVNVQPFTPEVFLRDGADDSGETGATAWGGRSADIIPSETEVANPDDQFKDLADLRSGDSLVGGKKNFLYVRVHNRKNVKLTADVELFRVPYDTLHQPATWQQIGAKVTVVDVPEKSSKFAPKIEWDAPFPPDPGPSKVHLVVALISRAGDPKPATGTINNLDSFWRFFLEGAPANNVAFRALRWRS